MRKREDILRTSAAEVVRNKVAMRAIGAIYLGVIYQLFIMYGQPQKLTMDKFSMLLHFARRLAGTGCEKTKVDESAVQWGGLFQSLYCNSLIMMMMMILYT